jgi:hypothetical protein
MLSQTLQLAYFPQDNRIWRVEWVANIGYNPAVPSESAFSVIISPLTDEVQKEYEDNSYNDKRYFYKKSDVNGEDSIEVYIGVGQSPLIDIGSLWKNGYCLNENVGIKETFDLVIDDANVQYLSVYHQQEFEGEKIPIFPLGQQFTLKKGRFVNCAFIESKGVPNDLIIPAHALINFYLCSSTAMAQAIYDGTFSNDRNKIVNLDKSTYSFEDDIACFWLRKEFYLNDAWTLSRIFCTAEGEKSARLVHDSLLTQRVKGDIFLFPKTIFPFIGSTSLTVYYKPVFCKEEKVFRKLVYAISHCTAPFPFSRVQAPCDHDNRQAEGEDTPEEEKKPGWGGKNKNLNPSNSPLGSSEEPSNYSENQSIPKLSDKFSFLKDKEVERPPKEKCYYKNEKSEVIKEISTNNQSTGKGTYGESTTSSASVGDKKPSLDTTFSIFNSAIHELNQDKKFITSIRPTVPETEKVPRIKPEKYRQWSFLDSNFKSRRAVIIADIEYNNKHLCLIDFKCRANESYSRALLSRMDHLPLSNHTIYETLIRLAHARGIWVNMVKLPKHLNKVITMRHGEKEINILVNRLKSILEKL